MDVSAGFAVLGIPFEQAVQSLREGTRIWKLFFFGGGGYEREGALVAIATSGGEYFRLAYGTLLHLYRRVVSFRLA